MVSPDAVARQLARGFQAHDDRDHDAARGHFRAVDRWQFDAGDPDTAADAYVAALWRKDEVEAEPRAGFADWQPVVAALRARCEAVGIDEGYATGTATAWRRHKAGGDYWTPMLRAQRAEVRAALDDPAYPGKNRGGQQGFGILPTLYLVGVECHDTRQWGVAVDLMAEYFAVLADHKDLDTNDNA